MNHLSSLSTDAQAPLATPESASVYSADDYLPWLQAVAADREAQLHQLSAPKTSPPASRSLPALPYSEEVYALIKEAFLRSTKRFLLLTMDAAVYPETCSSILLVLCSACSSESFLGCAAVALANRFKLPLIVVLLLWKPPRPVTILDEFYRFWGKNGARPIVVALTRVDDLRSVLPHLTLQTGSRLVISELCSSHLHSSSDSGQSWALASFAVHMRRFFRHADHAESGVNPFDQLSSTMRAYAPGVSLFFASATPIFDGLVPVERLLLPRYNVPYKLALAIESLKKVPYRYPHFQVGIPPLLMYSSADEYYACATKELCRPGNPAAAYVSSLMTTMIYEARAHLFGETPDSARNRSSATYGPLPPNTASSDSNVSKATLSTSFARTLISNTMFPRPESRGLHALRTCLPCIHIAMISDMLRTDSPYSIATFLVKASHDLVRCRAAQLGGEVYRSGFLYSVDISDNVYRKACLSIFLLLGCMSPEYLQALQQYKSDTSNLSDLQEITDKVLLGEEICESPIYKLISFERCSTSSTDEGASGVHTSPVERRVECYTDMMHPRFDSRLLQTLIGVASGHACKHAVANASAGPSSEVPPSLSVPSEWLQVCTSSYDTLISALQASFALECSSTYLGIKNYIKFIASWAHCLDFREVIHDRGGQSLAYNDAHKLLSPSTVPLRRILAFCYVFADVVSFFPLATSISLRRVALAVLYESFVRAATPPCP